MATYNGEKYLSEQLETILVNLKDEDEIIISDDGSQDGTLAVIAEFQKRFPHITVLQGPKKGVHQNFANAIAHASGDVIFLSDQDDLWMANKVETVLEAMKQPEVWTVVHDANVVDETGTNVICESFYELRHSKPGLFANLLRNSYLGCCVAFKRELKEYILPIPQNIEMHDTWIGLISEWKHCGRFIDDKLISYRRHGGNVTSMHHYPLLKMITNRIHFTEELLLRIARTH